MCVCMSHLRMYMCVCEIVYVVPVSMDSAVLGFGYWPHEIEI